MLLPFDASLASTFENNLPIANWADGIPDFTLKGIATVIENNTLKGSAQLSLDGNVTSNKGTIRKKMKVPYSGGPVSDVYILAMMGQWNGEWFVGLAHRNDGMLLLNFGIDASFPSGGGEIYYWNPTIGEIWELELDWDFEVEMRIKVYLGKVSGGVATQIADLDVSTFFHAFTPAPGIATISMAYDPFTPVDFAGWEFTDILMWTVAQHWLETTYDIQSDYIPEFNPLKPLHETIIYGKVTHNNLPVENASILFQPLSTFATQGQIGFYNFTVLSDATGLFEKSVPYSGSVNCSYNCSYSFGGTNYTKSGQLTVNLGDNFLAIS